MAYRSSRNEYDEYDEHDLETEYEREGDSNAISEIFASSDPDQSLPAEVTDEVIRHYSDMVWRIALTKTRSTHDAEDIFQEVFLKLALNEKPFASEEHRKAWLIRVTVNCCNSLFVAPWRKNVDTIDDAVISQLPDEDTVNNGGEDGATDVYAEILKLPQNMREVILLFYYENMSVRDIARALGTTEAVVKKRLSRARQRLKLEIEEKAD